MSTAKKMKNSHCYIAELPNELTLKIFDFLDYKAQLNVSATCKR